MIPIRSLMLCLLLALPFLSFSQDTTIYFNKNWKPCDKDTATYYRHALMQKNGKDSVTDFFLTGKVQMTGSYLSGNTLDEHTRNGHFVYYDSLGFKESEGNYNAGQHSGTWRVYYDHSTALYSVEDYSNDSSAYYTYYDSTFHCKTSEGGRSGEKCTGQWKYFYEQTDKIEKTEYYDNDTLTKTNDYYKNGNLEASSIPFSTEKGIDIVHLFDTTGKDIGFTIVYNKYTQRVRAGRNLEKYFKKNLEYPAVARAAKIEGVVRLRFIVKKDGSLCDVHIAQGIGGGCDEEAIRLISALNWKPAKNKQKIVDAHCHVDVTFKLPS